MQLIESPDLGSAVAGALRTLILHGDLAPGERLVETQLAERFGTSRGPIRDALVELERVGLVTALPRRGSFVRQFSRDDVDEVYSLRIALETLAVKRVIERRQPRPELRSRLAALVDAHGPGNPSAVVAADMDLHRAIVAASGHQRLAESWERLADQTMFLMVMQNSVDPMIQRPDGDHETIVTMIESGEVATAVDAVERHLDRARATMLEHWGDTWQDRGVGARARA